MTSPAKALALLDLFTVERPTWTADEFSAALGYSVPTCYRYVKDLVDAGILRKVVGGGYVLGPRIVQLDYQIRQTDPVLRASAAAMETLSQATGFDTTLSAMFGSRVIDIHRVSPGPQPVLVRYGRGRPRPTFLGAAGKVLAAFLPAAAQIKLYAELHAQAEGAGLGSSVAEFRAKLAQIRKEGVCFAFGELTASIGAAAVPVFDTAGEVVAGLSVVGRVERIRDVDRPWIAGLLREAGAEIRRSFESPPDVA